MFDGVSERESTCKRYFNAQVSVEFKIEKQKKKTNKKTNVKRRKKKKKRESTNTSLLWLIEITIQWRLGSKALSLSL